MSFFREEVNPKLSRQVAFIAVVGFLALLYLAWRSEKTSDAITQGLWDSCRDRQAQIEQYNDGLPDAYYAAVAAQQISINGTLATPAQQEQQRVLANGLASRLKFPEPNCGPDPQLR